MTNLLGTLPPNFFNVTVSASQEDMAQIMYSALMMGYMYRNAQYRIDLDYNAQVEGMLPNGAACLQLQRTFITRDKMYFLVVQK